MDNALSRRNVVLQLMVDNKKLTQAQANAAKAQSVQVVDTFQRPTVKNIRLILTPSLKRRAVKVLVSMIF